MRRVGKYRVKFLCESLACLRKNLWELNSHLTIVRGASLEVLVEYIISEKLQKVYVQESVGFYERERLEKLKRLLEKSWVSLMIVWDHTLVYKDDLPFSLSELPQVFTSFRKWVEKYSNILEPLSPPNSITSPSVEDTLILTLSDFGYEDFEVDPRRALEFVGWEDAAWKRLNHYLWESKSLSQYKETRNGLIWADYSSKFSAWLSLGCISARSIYAEVQRYEKLVMKNNSTYWLVFELLWRDFFQFIFLQDPSRFFKDYPESSEILALESDKRKFEIWKEGRLGVDFVDANMRELALTGFMSNRGRQNVASYLVNDLKLDWRLGAMYFESQLVDYDVASNWGNWAYVAWVGNDPREDRYFNIERQQSMYDKDAAYRKLWRN